MFLLKLGLSKEQFIATSAVLAVMIDFSRLLIYGWDATARAGDVDWPLVSVASFSAFMGAWIGNRLLRRMTIKSIQIIVSVLLMIVAAGLISGVL